MSNSQLLALFDQDQRIDLVYPDLRREVMPRVVRHIDTTGAGEGMIIHSRLSAVNAEDTIRQQISYFESLGQNFEWKVFDYDQPPDLKDRLAAHGFTVGDAEALVVLDLAEAPEALRQPPGPNIQRITKPEDLGDVQAIEQQVWDEDAAWVINLLGSALRNYPEQMSVYVAYVDRQPASAAWIYFPENSLFASLWGGSTVSKFRNRGLYTSLLAVRAQEARARQVRYLSVDASPMSQPILEKFGFELIAYSFACKWKSRTRPA